VPFVLSFEGVDSLEDMISVLRLKGFSFISAYSYTEAKATDAQRGLFHSKLATVYASCPSRYPRYIGGDFNGRVGPVDGMGIGPHGLMSEKYGNSNGGALADFACENKMSIASTFFRHNQARKWTWRSARGKRSNFTACLDYFLCPTRFLNKVKDCVTCGGWLRVSLIIRC
jgi:hypothetical protein